MPKKTVEFAFDMNDVVVCVDDKDELGDCTIVSARYDLDGLAYDVKHETDRGPNSSRMMEAEIAVK